MVQLSHFGLFGVYKRTNGSAEIVPITTESTGVNLSFSSSRITFTFSGNGSVEVAAFIKGQKISGRHTYFEY